MPTTRTLRRVVVTGMGVITPIGETLDTLWQNLMQGTSGIGYLTNIPEAQQTCKIGGLCHHFVPEAYLDKKEARRMDRFTQFAVAGTKGAFADAGLAVGDLDPTRLGVVVGSGAGGITTIEEQLFQCVERGYHKCSPFLVPMMISDMAAGRISIAFNVKGPSISVVTACATGADSIGTAMHMIQLGEIDVAIAGGAEAPVTSVAIAGFTAARAMSTRYNEPQRASRPFDKDRDGFVISEGAGILILEALEHAEARGAKIYAELVGYGRSSDANDVVQPHPEGEGAGRAMQAALKNAELKPEDIGYINAHGTSTPLGDIAETLAIKRVFGQYAHQGLAISSTKSMHGHMLGAAGAVEAIISIMALNNQMAPPTINLENQDVRCDLNYTPNKPQPLKNASAVMSNSFGFGGHNASLIFQTFLNN